MSNRMISYLTGLCCAAGLVPLMASAQSSNLADNCLVSCSNGTNPEYAVDGNRSGWFWESKWPCWLEIDLGQEHELTAINLFMWWGGDRRYYQYAIAVSPDRVKWTEIVDERTNTAPSTAEGRLYPFRPTPARFVRLTTTSNNVNAAVHVREIEVYGKGVPVNKLNSPGAGR